MGVALTARQQAFVDAYAGNATDAARKAGYKGTDATLGQVGHENLKKPEIARAIQARNAGPAQRRIATREDRQAIWTQVMLDPGEKTSDRLKASELLGRSEADFTDKLQVDAKVTLEQLLEKAGA